MEDYVTVLSNLTGRIKEKIPKILLSGSLLLGVGALLNEAITEVDAAHTTITKVDNHSNRSVIHVNHDGQLELPDGSRVHTTNVQYDVRLNGVYTFHTYGSNDVITRDSALIDSIKNEVDDLLRTNKDTVELTIKSRDNLSGIHQYRLKNEANGSWNGWSNVSSPKSIVNQKIDWKLNTSQEGIRTVFAQFKDRAGNVTESNLSNRGSTKHNAPYARVVYTTKGPEFDVGIVDLNKMGSTYWVSPNRPHVVKRSNNPYVEIVFNNIRSEWSVPQNIYTSVNGQPYQKRPLSALTSDGRLIVEIPAAERKNGPGQIKLYIDDLVVNNSDVYTIPYYYDDQAPTVTTSIKQGDNKNLERETYYNPITNKDETVNLTLTQNVLLDVTPKDAHSSMNRQTARPGFARILVREQTRYEHEGPWVNNKSRVYARNADVAGGHPFTQISLTDGNTHRLNLNLSHGFETRFRVEIMDNAGNTRTHYTETFRQSNLRLVSFKILEIVNPSRDDDEVTITQQMNPDDLPTMSAGGNVTLEAAFDLQKAFNYKDIYGQIEIEITGNGYTNKLENIILTGEEGKPGETDQGKILTDKDFPRYEEIFTIPEDAPVGAEVVMKGWLTVDFEDGVSHTIYFPSKNGNIRWRIGVVGNHIQDHLKFNITR